MGQSIATLSSKQDPNVVTKSIPSALVLYNQETASLADGAELDTGFLDVTDVNSLLLDITSDTTGLTLIQTLRNSSGGIETPVTVPVPLTDTPFQFPARATGARFQLQNNSGSAITDVKFLVKGGTFTPTITPLVSSPLPQSQALLTQSVIIGQDLDGNFKNGTVNADGAQKISDFLLEATIDGNGVYTTGSKFGRNSDIDSGQESVWNGGGFYTGFNCTQAEVLSVVSDDVNDAGSLVSSGTATGGNSTTIVDSGATFITDGVAVNDIVINDTQQFHGHVTEVTSETTLTVYQFENGGEFEVLSFISGDSYRIATATSTGAAVLKLSQMLDANWLPFAEYIILNGTTAVTTLGAAIRQSRGQVVLDGGINDNSNEGEIIARQSITTANITMVMPADSGQSAICCTTVPDDKIWIITKAGIEMGRASGNAGSANCAFQIRSFKGSFQTKQFPIITDGISFERVFTGGIVVQPRSDVHWFVQNVSDTNTIVGAYFDYVERDKATL